MDSKLLVPNLIQNQLDSDKMNFIQIQQYFIQPDQARPPPESEYQERGQDRKKKHTKQSHSVHKHLINEVKDIRQITNQDAFTRQSNRCQSQDFLAESPRSSEKAEEPLASSRVPKNSKGIPASTYPQITGDKLRHELYFNRKAEGGVKEYMEYRELMGLYQTEIKRRWDERAQIKNGYSFPRISMEDQIMRQMAAHQKKKQPVTLSVNMNPAANKCSSTLSRENSVRQEKFKGQRVKVQDQQLIISQGQPIVHHSRNTSFLNLDQINKNVQMKSHPVQQPPLANPQPSSSLLAKQSGFSKSVNQLAEAPKSNLLKKNHHNSKFPSQQHLQFKNFKQSVLEEQPSQKQVKTIRSQHLSHVPAAFQNPPEGWKPEPSKLSSLEVMKQKIVIAQHENSSKSLKRTGNSKNLHDQPQTKQFLQFQSPPDSVQRLRKVDTSTHNGSYPVETNKVGSIEVTADHLKSKQAKLAAKSQINFHHQPIRPPPDQIRNDQLPKSMVNQLVKGHVGGSQYSRASQITHQRTSSQEDNFSAQLKSNASKFILMPKIGNQPKAVPAQPKMQLGVNQVHHQSQAHQGLQPQPSSSQRQKHKKNIMSANFQQADPKKIVGVSSHMNQTAHMTLDAGQIDKISRNRPNQMNANSLQRNTDQLHHPPADNGNYRNFDSSTPPKRQDPAARTHYSRFETNYLKPSGIIVKGVLSSGSQGHQAPALERPKISSSIHIPSVPEDSPPKTLKPQQPWANQKTVDLNSQFQASSKQLKKPQTMVEKLIKMSEASQAAKPAKKMIKNQADFIPKTSKATNKQQQLADMSRISERPEGWINDSELTISSFNLTKQVQEPRVQVSRETSTEPPPTKQEKAVIFSCYQDGSRPEEKSYPDTQGMPVRTTKKKARTNSQLASSSFSGVISGDKDAIREALESSSQNMRPVNKQKKQKELQQLQRQYNQMQQLKFESGRPTEAQSKYSHSHSKSALHLQHLLPSSQKEPYGDSHQGRVRTEVSNDSTRSDHHRKQKSAMGPSISMDNHPPKNYMHVQSFSSKQFGDQNSFHQQPFQHQQQAYNTDASRNMAGSGLPRQKSRHDQLDSASISQFYFNSFQNQYKPDPKVGHPHQGPIPRQLQANFLDEEVVTLKMNKMERQISKKPVVKKQPLRQAAPVYSTITRQEKSFHSHSSGSIKGPSSSKKSTGILHSSSSLKSVKKAPVIGTKKKVAVKPTSHSRVQSSLAQPLRQASFEYF